MSPFPLPVVRKAPGAVGCPAMAAKKAAKKRSKGRPRKAKDGTIRKVRGALRASEGEWAFIKPKVKDSGLTVGEWLLKLALRGFKAKS